MWWWLMIAKIKRMMVYRGDFVVTKWTAANELVMMMA